MVAKAASGIDDEILAESIRILYINTRRASLGGLVVATVVTIFFWHRSVPRIDLAIWLAMVMAGTAIRHYVVAAYNAATPSAANVDFWAKMAVVESIIGAVVWGSASFLLLRPEIMETEILVTVIVLMSGTAGLLSMASFLPAFFTYATIVVLPMCLRMAWLGGPHEMLMGLIGSIYLVLLFSMALNYNRTFIASGRLMMEKNHLALDLELARAAAEAGSRAKSEFLATMSHEIRTPLNGVLGMTSLVLQTPLSPVKRQYIETAHESGQALLAIVNDILDFAKIEAGRLELELIDFALRPLIMGTVASMSARAEEKKLTLTTCFPQDLPPLLRGDPAHLRQILLNLTGNAIKFTETGGVTVTTEVVALDEGTVTLRFAVIDTGIGVPKASRGKLFQSFTQGDLSITRRFGGTGLGLVICRRLVDAMGGSIGFDSDEGRGSTFWFKIPFALSLPVPVTVPPEGDVVTVAPRRILLVEDMVINQKVVGGLLEHAGHEVTIVDNGAAAVERLRQSGFDLVLMDMYMPKMDGLEATRRIRSLPGAVAKVPILGLTASILKDDLARCREAGMNDVLAKPFSMDDFNAVLAHLKPREEEEVAPVLDTARFA
ncbi:MAG: response regulator, partial [Alphaproteobacteria bacterium]|nr:response regulator [Alphaproteobacteria bacterium]